MYEMIKLGGILFLFLVAAPDKSINFAPRSACLLPDFANVTTRTEIDARWRQQRL